MKNESSTFIKNDNSHHWHPVNAEQIFFRLRAHSRSDEANNRGPCTHGEGSVNTVCEIRLRRYRCAVGRKRPRSHTHSCTRRFVMLQSPKHTSRTHGFYNCMRECELHDVVALSFDFFVLKSASYWPWESNKCLGCVLRHLFWHPSRHADDRDADNMDTELTAPA